MYIENLDNIEVALESLVKLKKEEIELNREIFEYNKKLNEKHLNISNMNADVNEETLKMIKSYSNDVAILNKVCIKMNESIESLYTEFEKIKGISKEGK